MVAASPRTTRPARTGGRGWEGCCDRGGGGAPSPRVLGSNGSGKSHFLRLLAAGGSDPSPEHEPADDTPVAPVKHTGRVVLGPRVRPGWFAQNHGHPELVGRTLLEILHRGDGHRSGL